MNRFVLAIAIGVTLLLPSPAQAELRAGAASADITPPVGGLMYGYGARGTNKSQGVHDPLYAKAVVIESEGERLAIVTLDLGTFLTENTDNVRAIVKRKTGIENVLCVASHSHSTPGLQSEFPSKRKPYIRDAEAKIAAAIVDAAENLRPARLGVGWGRAEEGHNRRKVSADGTVLMFWQNRKRVPTNPVDYSVGVIRIETPDGDTIATLVNFACHPVVLGPENLLISADYPGYFKAAVEEALGGECLFLQGAAGDINPYWDKTPPSEGAYEQAEKMGRTIADEVIRVSKAIGDFEDVLPISFHTEIIPLASRMDVERKDLKYLAEINTVLIGSDIALATFPGEFFVEHGLSLKRRSKIKNTMFIGYCNGRLRYFPTIEACAEGGYGASSATAVEVGGGERLVNRALVNLFYQADLIHP